MRSVHLARAAKLEIFVSHDDLLAIAGCRVNVHCRWLHFATKIKTDLAFSEHLRDQKIACGAGQNFSILSNLSLKINILSNYSKYWVKLMPFVTLSRLLWSPAKMRKTMFTVFLKLKKFEIRRYRRRYLHLALFALNLIRNSPTSSI